MFVKIDKKEYEVREKPYKKGFAYEVQGNMFVYFGSVDSDEEIKKNGIYKIDGRLKVIKRFGKLIPSSKCYDRFPEVDLGGITLGEDFLEFLDEVEEEKTNVVKSQKFSELRSNNSRRNEEIFAPEVLPLDNTLVRIVKGWLKEKQVSMASLRPRFKDDMEMNNFKRGLRSNKGKMSIERFEKWAKVLDKEWEIVHKDSEE